MAQSVESSEEPQKTPVVSMAPLQSGPGGESVFRTLATLAVSGNLHISTCFRPPLQALLAVVL